MTYKALTRSVSLPNLSENDIVDISEYLEKLRFFNKYSNQGTYITDDRYREYSDTGLHYYAYTTLIQYFSDLQTYYKNAVYAKILFSKDYKLSCQTLTNDNSPADLIAYPTISNVR